MTYLTSVINSTSEQKLRIVTAVDEYCGEKAYLLFTKYFNKCLSDGELLGLLEICNISENYFESITKRIMEN